MVQCLTAQHVRRQVFPKCGDGVDFSVILSPVGGGPVQYLHEADYELSDKPTRQRLHFYLDKLETGDVIDFTVYPRGQHDCDGALLLEAQIWEQDAYKARAPCLPTCFSVQISICF